VIEDEQCIARGVPSEVLTPDLIADVFGMNAAVQPAARGLRIDYDAPV